MNLSDLYVTDITYAKYSPSCGMAPNAMTALPIE